MAQNMPEVQISFSDNGEIEIGKELIITAKIPKDERISDFKVLFNRQGEDPSIIKDMVKTKEEMYKEYETSVKFVSFGAYFFFFSLKRNGVYTSIKINRKDGNPFFTMEESPYWRIFVKQNFSVPKWAKGAIWYQIFVDRFYHSVAGNSTEVIGRNYRKWGEMPNWQRNEQGEFHNNDFFRGNLKGIEEKLDYLESLGVTVVYISPINECMYRYDRYASTNHLKIDPDAGDFADLESLYKKIQKKGMHLVLDIAVNHCSSDNPIFQEAWSNPASKYRDWFYFQSDGSYRYWYGEFKDMPIFNQENIEFQKYICGENGVIETFAPYVDGFRLDVAEEINCKLLEKMYASANCSKKRLMLAESWHKAPMNALGKQYDTTTNYLFTNAIHKYVLYGEWDYFSRQIKELIEDYPKDTVNSIVNSLDTHDIVRALNILNGRAMRNGMMDIWKIDEAPSPWHKEIKGEMVFLTTEFRRFEFENDKLGEEEYELCKKRLKVAMAIQYFLPGNPCIFYGTEVGMHGYKDPFNRKCFPWDNMDEDLLEYVRILGRVRKRCEVLAEGEFTILECNERILVFKRYYADKSVIVAVNRTEETYILTESYDTVLLFESAEVRKNEIELFSYGVCIILKCC